MTDDYSHPAETINKLRNGFSLILDAMGIDEESPHFQGTAERTALAWREELCRGLFEEAPTITTFPAEGDEMILLRNIPVRSLCAHHLLPFIGVAHIAYVPGAGEIVGLSKLSRLTDWYARRPQVQEKLTSDIADHLHRLVGGEGAGGVGVMIRANHFCMALRGVKHDGDMVTSALRGVFYDKPEARAEFLSLAKE